MRNRESKFWSHVSIGGHNGCWLWLAGKDRDGYGKFSLDSKHLRAHRAAYEFLVGEIPEGMVLLHSCDNPSCVNPKHLSPGSHKENVQDAFSKGRRGVGGSHPNAQLTNDQAKYVRHLYFAERQPLKELAEFFEVSTHVVRNIVNGKSYRRESCQAAT